MIWAVSLLTMNLIAHCLTRKVNFMKSILSLLRFGTALAARTETVLYPFSVHTLRLRLNAFRGEPASSEFDWYFTPNHNSSVDFSTSVGRDLHFVSPKLHPGHG